MGNSNIKTVLRMYLFVVTAFVAFWGLEAGAAEEAFQAQEESTFIQNENLSELLSSEDRTLPTITANPFTYLRLVEKWDGPKELEMTRVQMEKMSETVVDKIATSNKLHFNQKVDLSATFKVFSASSSTEFGWEQVTNKEKMSTKEKSKTIQDSIKTKISIKTGQYYCIIAEIKVYVFQLNGKRHYVEVPMEQLITGIKGKKELEYYLKEKESFSHVLFDNGKGQMRGLTTYTVDQMVAAMPNNLVKNAVKSHLPEPDNYYTLTSSKLRGIGLQQWRPRGTWYPWYVGCLPQTAWDSWMTGEGFGSLYFKQWEFKPVEKYMPDVFYIVNRQFKTSLYASKDEGMLSKSLPTYGDTTAYQWKVFYSQERGGTIKIQNMKTKQFLSTWGESSSNSYSQHYNCGPEDVYYKIRSVSGKWNSFCKKDRGNIWVSSQTIANAYFNDPLEREYAKYMMNDRFRNRSPTCSGSINRRMWNNIYYFRKRTEQKTIPKSYKLWNLKKVSF